MADQGEGVQRKNKMSSSRKLQLKSLALAIAKSLGAEQEVMRSRERERFLQENCEPLETEGLETSEIQDLCRRLHSQIDLIDDELYDLQFKVSKGAKEVDDLTQKVQELRGGRSQRPALRRVRMSADALLRALLGNKHKVTLDLRASLKQVKKEEERDHRDLGDWRKNIDALSGMEGRKKKFETTGGIVA